MVNSRILEHDKPYRFHMRENRLIHFALTAYGKAKLAKGKATIAAYKAANSGAGSPTGSSGAQGYTGSVNTSKSNGSSESASTFKGDSFSLTSGGGDVVTSDSNTKTMSGSSSGPTSSNQPGSTGFSSSGSGSSGSGSGTVQGDTVGLQTESNAYGTQQGGPNVPMGGVNLGTDSFGLSGDYQPALDVIGGTQGVYDDQLQTNMDQLEINYDALLNTYDTQESQALEGLQYDEESGTFTGLSNTETNRIKTPYDEAILGQQIAQAGQLTDLSLAQAQTAMELQKQRREAVEKTEENLLVTRTFAGLSGAFGSSAVFNKLQKTEMAGQQILRDISDKQNMYTQYYSDKTSQIKATYDLGIASLQRQVAEQLNTRYTDLVNKVDEVRFNKALSGRQQLVDIQKAQQDYNLNSLDLAGKTADIMIQYNQALRGAEEKAEAEDLAIRDEVGDGILNVYDTLVPGFVPSPGKVAEFTKTIYEGLKLYKETGGREGYANMQAGLADLMTAIKSNTAVFNRYNPAMQPKKGAGAESGRLKLTNAQAFNYYKLTGNTATYVDEISQEDAKTVGIESGTTKQPTNSWMNLLNNMTEIPDDPMAD
jgi:hypothetical protein